MVNSNASSNNPRNGWKFIFIRSNISCPINLQSSGQWAELTWVEVNMECELNLHAHQYNWWIDFFWISAHFQHNNFIEYASTSKKRYKPMMMTCRAGKCIRKTPMTFAFPFRTNFIKIGWRYFGSTHDAKRKLLFGWRHYSIFSTIVE